MRLSWFWLLIFHVNDFGYSHGLLPGAIGTAAFLVAAVALGTTLHRSRYAALAGAALLFCGGVGWLAAH